MAELGCPATFGTPKSQNIREKEKTGRNGAEANREENITSSTFHIQHMDTALILMFA